MCLSPQDDSGNLVPFDAAYGTGEVAGVTVRDTLYIGNVSILDQTIGVVLDATDDFARSTCDGLFVSPLTMLACRRTAAALNSCCSIQTWSGDEIHVITTCICSFVFS